MSGPERGPGTVTAGAQTSGWGGGDPIQGAGERAITHHIACQRRAPLRWALVPSAVNYLCDECGARVSVGADGQHVGPQVPANKPMTDFARETLSKLPAVLAGLKGRPITKTSVWKGLGVDRNTLDAWITNRWLTWPPTG